MDSRKYVKDYIIEEDYDPVTGRMKRRPVYCGKYFVFIHQDKIADIKKLYVTCSLGSLISYLAILFINAPCTHNWYTMVPLALMMLPMLFLPLALRRLFTAKEKVTREHRDKICDRFRLISGASAVLAVLALLGHLVFSILVGDSVPDLLYYLFTLLILLSSGKMFRKRGMLSMKEEE